MGKKPMSWLTEYSKTAKRTDQLIGEPNHALLLAAGMFGEAGSVLAELKKEKRETDAYPAYRKRLVEETGDCLWYLTRLTAVLDPSALQRLDVQEGVQTEQSHDSLANAVALGVAAGQLLRALQHDDRKDAIDALRSTWDALFKVAEGADIEPGEAAKTNLDKTQSRWPESRVFSPFFDNDLSEEEQLPRELDIEFRPVQRGNTKAIILRCNGLNFGDRLTDNIGQPDFYRYHDVFHFAYIVYLGWSPVIRALLKCKRKSDPELDNNQDGARARIIEEAVSAIVFSRAKEMAYYDGADHVDYDLLKAVQDFIHGFEVESVPLWQWETAILEGYSIFRSLLEHGGGHVMLRMDQRELLYRAITK